MSTPRKNPDHIQSIDAAKHRKLRVKPDQGYPHAKQQHVAPILLSELAVAGANYPLAFIKRPDEGKYLLAAMLGLRAGENIYYAEEFWESSYVPMAIQRSPFVIGYDDTKPEGDELVTCLEMNSSYLGETAGIALFNDAGEQTDFLQSRHQILNTLFESQKMTDRFITAVSDLGLITPMLILLQLQDKEVKTVGGLFTLDEAKVTQLNAEQLKSLHDNGFLAPCYLILASLHQLNRLIRLRNKKGGDQILDFQIDFNPQPQTQAPQAQ